MDLLLMTSRSSARELRLLRVTIIDGGRGWRGDTEGVVEVEGASWEWFAGPFNPALLGAALTAALLISIRAEMMSRVSISV